jgi:hypothetical protein
LSYDCIELVHETSTKNRGMDDRCQPHQRLGFLFWRCQGP